MKRVIGKMVKRETKDKQLVRFGTNPTSLEYLGVEMSIVRTVLFAPIPSTRANKTWTRANERKERGKARLCLLGLLDI